MYFSGTGTYTGATTVSGGTLQINPGGQLPAAQEYVGTSGAAASVVQTGGSNVVSSQHYQNGLFLGYASSSNGTYYLDGGLLSCAEELVGYSASGSLTQSGGTNTIGYGLSVGVGDNGSYTLTGSGQLSAPAEYIGFESSGSFLQSGGTNLAGNLAVAAYGDSGTYTLNGGLLDLTGLPQGSGNATFNFGGGTLQVFTPLGLSTSQPMVLTTVGSNGVFDTNRQSLTLSGNLSGPGGLQEIGGGLMILSGDNTYGGATIVTSGMLEDESSSGLPFGTAFSSGPAGR